MSCLSKDQQIKLNSQIMLKILIFCWLSSSLSDAASILGVWPVASRSHYSLGLALFEELAANGHNVSYLI